MTKPKTERQFIGAIERTGVYISKSDMDSLIDVIAKAKVKDDIIAKKVGHAQFGQTGLLSKATMGSMGIQDFVRQLVKVYGFDDSDKVLYGVNGKREIFRWLTPDEAARI